MYLYTSQCDYPQGKNVYIKYVHQRTVYTLEYIFLLSQMPLECEPLCFLLTLSFLLLSVTSFYLHISLYPSFFFLLDSLCFFKSSVAGMQRQGILLMGVWYSEITIIALADRTMAVFALYIESLDLVSALVTTHRSDWNKQKQLISSLS